MKITVDSREFAECMGKIQPAVSVTKEKKETVEGSIQLMVTKEKKVAEGYVGLAVAYDGKKQLMSMFLASELEMEEKKKDINVSGKRLCDISAAMNNGNEVPMTLTVDKNCLIKKGGSEVHVPLGEEPVIIFPTNDWYLRTSVDTKALTDLLAKGARFFKPGDEGSVGNVCICFDMEKKKLWISSTDAFKLAFYGMDAEYEASKLLKKMDEEGAEPSATLDKEGGLLKVEVDGEQMKVLAKFLAGKNTEICVYEKYLYFKSGTDIALFMVKDVSGGKKYAITGVVDMEKGHSRSGMIHMAPKDVLDALTVFDVANQGEDPFVYIMRDESGALCLSTKGKISKTLVACEIKGEFKEMVLNSKILRQVVMNYEKDDTMIVFTGTSEESVIIKDKEDSEDFNIISRIFVE